LLAVDNNNTPPASNQETLPAVIVTGRQDNLVGIADSATVGVTGAEQTADRPLLRVGELLETVPGLIITQHAGGGKANQYFLRGFNLDHGTDFATFLDGVPLNMPSHAHGQGYADMNVVIPELIETIQYQKGPYYAATGDFGTAGAAYLNFYKTLPQAIASFEVGGDGYERLVLANSSKVGTGTLLYGIQVEHDDGPWLRPDDYRKYNQQISWATGDSKNGHSITFRGYQGTWNSSDQIPTSLVADGTLSPYGTMNPTDGGLSHYFSLSTEWHQQGGGTRDQAQVYVYHYDLDLFSDFTYYLNNPVLGDQFEQADSRTGAGLNLSHSIASMWDGRKTETTFGLQFRNDWVNNGLFDTVNRSRYATVVQDSFCVGELGLYAENKIQWSATFRSILGLRIDEQFAQVTALTAADSGRSTSTLPSPKLTLIWGPWDQTEYFLQAGSGFHSNDARGTTLTSGGATPLQGLVAAHGAEIGIRTSAIPNLQSTLSFWYLRNNSELVLDGDTGTLSPEGPSQRYGIEWANYYTLNRWITLDFDYAASQAIFLSPDADGGRSVPEAVGQVASAGITFRDSSGWNGSLRLRYFGPRDLISTGAVTSSATTVVNAEIGYQLTPHWHIAVQALNLLNQQDQDIAYYYTSQTSPTALPSTQVHFHPSIPREFRLALTGQF
jgi:hypothetical protein